MVIGQRIKALREESGLKLKEIADYLNVSIRSINRYEDGTREPSLEIVVKLCKLFGVSSDYLLGIADSY